MTVSELIERLEEYRNLIGDDCEVRLMTQESWPFENNITGLCSAAEIKQVGGVTEIETEDVVYLCEGQQLGYGTKVAWRACY